MPPCLHHAQVNGALRLESFDAFMPPAVDFWRTVTDEHYDLLEKRSQQGDSAVLADDAFRERSYQSALRAEGAMQIFLALAAGAEVKTAKFATPLNR